VKAPSPHQGGNASMGKKTCFGVLQNKVSTVHCPYISFAQASPRRTRRAIVKSLPTVTPSKIALRSSKKQRKKAPKQNNKKRDVSLSPSSTKVSPTRKEETASSKLTTLLGDAIEKAVTLFECVAYVNQHKLLFFFLFSIIILIVR